MRLETIVKEISEDPRNKEFTQRGILPILQVDPQAKICIIGQAPGRKVEQNGIPFHDKSGQTLMEWMGISASIFYSKQIAIVPMDFYYPGKGKTGDLPPRPWVADTYHKKLFDNMPSVEMTILVGKYAMTHYLHHSMKKNLTETVRSFSEYLPLYFPIAHPSPLNFRWQQKNPWFKHDVLPVLRTKIAEILSLDEE